MINVVACQMCVEFSILTSRRCINRLSLVVKNWATSFCSFSPFFLSLHFFSTSPLKHSLQLGCASHRIHASQPPSKAKKHGWRGESSELIKTRQLTNNIHHNLCRSFYAAFRGTSAIICITPNLCSM